MILLNEAENISLWQDYINTTFDPAHIGAELTFTIVFDLLISALLWPQIKNAIKRHDKERHNVD